MTITDGDYIVRMIDHLPGDIHAAIRIDKDGFGNIYINDSLSPMGKKRAFLHELRHLMRDDMFNQLPISEVEGE